MSLFGKFDRDFGTNLKIHQCGSNPLERATAQLVLQRLDVEHVSAPNEGVVSASRAHPAQLAMKLAGIGFSAEQCDAALEALARVGIIERRASGEVYLRKWFEWSDRPMTNAEKCRAYRDRKKGSTPDDTMESVATPDAVSRHDSVRNDTERHHGGVATPTDKSTVQESHSDARARANGQPAAPEETQSAAAAAPEARSPEVVHEVLIADVLLEAGFGNPLTRWRAATLLAEKGMTGDDARDLWRLAQAKGKEPVKLLSHWIAENLWRSVLDEQGMKRKERAARSRGRKARAERGEDFPVEVSEP